MGIQCTTHRVKGELAKDGSINPIFYILSNVEEISTPSDKLYIVKDVNKHMIISSKFRRYVEVNGVLNEDTTYALKIMHPDIYTVTINNVKNILIRNKFRYVSLGTYEANKLIEEIVMRTLGIYIIGILAIIIIAYVFNG